MMNSSKPTFFENPQHRPHQAKQGGANLKIRCLACPNFHMSKQGKPTQYLGICDFFKNQSLSKQKEIIKTHKVCHICLSPKTSCRKEPDLSICNKQAYFNLKCRQCGELKHHTAMCPEKTNSYQTEFQPDSLSQTQNWQDVQSFHPQQSSHPPPPTSNSSLPNSGSSSSYFNASCAFSDISNSYQ